jgi:micrococcal nuclease
VVLGLAALISSSFSCGSAAAPKSAPSSTLVANATMVRAVDGDTVDVKIGEATERVRLIGVNTPESVKRDSPVECFGVEASKFTHGLLPEGTPVYLAYVYRVPDGLFVNLELARQGFAQTLTFPPNVAHTDEFVEAVRAAEAANLGLWAACGG